MFPLLGETVSSSGNSIQEHDRFDFDIFLKEYLRFVSEREIVDAEQPDNAILVSPTSFVKYVVKHLNESFQSNDGFDKDIPRELCVM